VSASISCLSGRSPDISWTIVEDGRGSILPSAISWEACFCSGGKYSTAVPLVTGAAGPLSSSGFPVKTNSSLGSGGYAGGASKESCLLQGVRLRKMRRHMINPTTTTTPPMAMPIIAPTGRWWLIGSLGEVELIDGMVMMCWLAFCANDAWER
jgi:hypothetical protein